MRVLRNVLVSCCLVSAFAPALASTPRAPRASASVPYMIVTDASLAPAFAPLAAAHTAAGLAAEVHTVQDIVAAYPVAADDAERIRDFLVDAHANLGTRFVLLGGDDPLVPMRRVFLRLSAATGLPDLLLPTDQYYACLAGTWNADGDALWGELPYPGLGEPGDDVHALPDLAVGRAPVTTVAQAQVFVAKSLAALAQQDAARPLAALFAADAIPVGPDVIDNAAFTETCLPILAARPGTHVARLYQLSANWPGSLPENRQGVLDSLNHGYDMALLDGQGGAGVFQAGSYPADLIAAADFGGLTNPGATFALVLSAYTTQPGPGSVGAAWMNDPAGGATAVLGSTDIQFLGLTNQFGHEFLHQAFELHVPTQGEALAATLTALAGQISANDLARLTTLGNLLFGDPAIAWPGSRVDNPTPTLLSLVDSETAAGVARLSWYAAGATAQGALVERRADGADWETLGAPTEAGDGLLGYEDHVAGGGRFDYRLRLAGGEVSPEAWLDVPPLAVLRLAGFAPNPAVGPPRVAFTLPSAAPATIEVVDVAGRRVAGQGVGALGVGPHTIDLAGATHVPPGVYWIRLTQAGRVLVARGVRLR